jgi:hypothetical protein
LIEPGTNRAESSSSPTASSSSFKPPQQRQQQQQKLDASSEMAVQVDVDNDDKEEEPEPGQGRFSTRLQCGVDDDDDDKEPGPVGRFFTLPQGESEQQQQPTAEDGGGDDDGDDDAVQPSSATTTAMEARRRGSERLFRVVDTRRVSELTCECESLKTCNATLAEENAQLRRVLEHATKNKCTAAATTTTTTTTTTSASDPNQHQGPGSEDMGGHGGRCPLSGPHTPERCGRMVGRGDDDSAAHYGNNGGGGALALAQELQKVEQGQRAEVRALEVAHDKAQKDLGGVRTDTC